jgi:hypothetical protein
LGLSSAAGLSGFGKITKHYTNNINIFFINNNLSISGIKHKEMDSDDVRGDESEWEAVRLWKEINEEGDQSEEVEKNIEIIISALKDNAKWMDDS